MDHSLKTSLNKNLRRSGLGKKIKNEITKPLSVFAATPPGFSEIAKTEASRYLKDIKNLHITKGGISFLGNMEDIIKANFLLGVPTKILVRLKKFHAENFNELSSNLQKVPFELFLSGNKKVKVHATARKSRLIHTGAIEERAVAAIKTRLEENETLISENSLENPYIHIRISNDQATISVDSSGEPLYKRDIKKFVAKAPLRENLARAMILKSSYNPQYPFYDPMCGSGTFSLEAILQASDIPPGIFRNFSFESWPLCLYMDIEEIKRDLLSQKKEIPSYVFASDMDFKNVSIAKQNICNANLDTSFFCACTDFFNMTPKEKKGTIALNPPYGIRLETNKNFYNRIHKTLKNNFKGWHLIYIIPEQIQLDYFSKKNFDRLNFIHGGIDMNLFTGIIN